MQRHNMTVHSLVSYNASSDELFIDGLEREKSLLRKGVMLLPTPEFDPTRTRTRNTPPPPDSKKQVKKNIGKLPF
jgi:hypothetical protein